MSGNKKTKRKRKSFRIVLILFVIFLVYSIAVQVTKIDLKEPLEPQRQENLVELIRDLAHPDFFDYENITRSTNVSLIMPCPEKIQGSQVNIEDRVVILAPNCATTTQDLLTLTGEGFGENIQGIVRWYPLDSPTTRVVTDFRTDKDGNFNQSFTMPDIRESEEIQRLEIVERLDRSITGLSETSTETITKIIETILMALMASTLGTVLAIPISFLGARNIMSNVGAPLAAIMAATVAIPIGGGIAWLVTQALVDLSDQLTQSILLGLVSLGVIIAITWVLLYAGRSAIVDQERSMSQRIFGSARILLAMLFAILGIAVLGQLGIEAGEWLRINLQWRQILGINFFGFIGEFVLVISQLTVILMAIFVGFLGAIVLASLASQYGQEAVLHLLDVPARALTALLTFAGVTFVIFAFLFFVNWICLLGLCSRFPENPMLSMLLISAVIGLVAAGLSLLSKPKRLYPVGMVTYTITRSILNVMRAIEPVIMGFVLVVWVGIGPFAGVMALMLHSIADLGKLFSEQVENIDEGPVEAVTATGASKVQTIIYAVIPQIVPHYTAFIFYRWDINVRLSTIIGFVGGGGIGLILFRSVNLVQYHKAAVMVIAIAIVVTLLDYSSSKIRTRIT
jgi:phosphonate ABC transporter permease subunit PhnE